LPLGAFKEARFSTNGFESLPLEPPSPEARRQALMNRSDVRSALADFAASQSALQLAIAGQYPDIHLGPGYVWNSGSAGDNEWQLGATLTLPVFNQNRGAIAEAMTKRQEAALNFIAVQAQAIGQIDSALAGYSSALQQAKISLDLSSSLDQRLESVRGMEKAGDVDPLTFASAEVEFSAGALSRLDALAKAQQALGQLEDAVQSPSILSKDVLRNAQSAQFTPIFSK